jgi:hypothetical protein
MAMTIHFEATPMTDEQQLDQGRLPPPLASSNTNKSPDKHQVEQMFDP